MDKGFFQAAHITANPGCAEYKLFAINSYLLQFLPFFFLHFLFFFFFFLVFRDRVSLYSPGCPGTHFVDQAGLELRNSPASASQVLGLKACATTPGSSFFISNPCIITP
jgi:hypothetical protein